MLKKLKEADQDRPVPLTQKPARVWYDGFRTIITQLWSWRWSVVAGIGALGLF